MSGGGYGGEGGQRLIERRGQDYDDLRAEVMADAEVFKLRQRSGMIRLAVICRDNTSDDDLLVKLVHWLATNAAALRCCACMPWASELGVPVRASLPVALCPAAVTAWQPPSLGPGLQVGGWSWSWS